MLLTFLNLHIPVLDKKHHIKNYTFTGLNKTDSELFKAPAVRQKIAGAMNVFWLRPLKGDSRHRARPFVKGGSVQDEVMAWEIPALLQGQEKMMWCLLLSQKERRGDGEKKGNADSELDMPLNFLLKAGIFTCSIPVWFAQPILCKLKKTCSCISVWVTPSDHKAIWNHLQLLYTAVLSFKEFSHCPNVFCHSVHVVRLISDYD